MAEFLHLISDVEIARICYNCLMENKIPLNKCQAIKEIFEE